MNLLHLFTSPKVRGSLTLAVCLSFWQCSRDVVSIQSKPLSLAPYEISLDDAVSVAEKYATSALPKYRLEQNS